MFTFLQAYIVPKGKGSDPKPTEIILKMILENINVETNRLLIHVAFNLSTTWFEKRATYANLKHDFSLNYVPSSNVTLWFPTIDFVNTLNHEASKNDDLVDVFVIRSNYTKVFRDEEVPEISKRTGFYAVLVLIFVIIMGEFTIVKTLLYKV